MAKLLFVNTFSHDRVEDFNIDFVKFSSGALAIIREVRIIPGGAMIPVVESPQRQGITAPNTFNLEVFAKNSKRSDASVFERIAVFEYRFDSDIRFQIPAYATDGILFKGKYTALTVAIYGDPVSGDVANVEATNQSSSTIVGSTGAHSSQFPDAGLIVQQPPPANVVFPPQVPGQILTIGTPIPTWVGPPSASPVSVTPTVIRLTPPPAVAFNPLIPPPISVLPAAYPSTGGVVVHIPFDPTRPPPTFHTPQHSPRSSLVPPQQPPPQISPSTADQRLAPSSSHHHHQSSSSSRRHHEPPSKVKRYESSSTSDRSSRDRYSTEGKPIETIGTVKPVVSSLSPGNAHSRGGVATSPVDEIQLEEGEYAGSDADNSEKFDLENISEEEFEFDDAMAAHVNDSDLQEDLLCNLRFDPYKFVLAPLKFFRDPSLTPFEIESLKIGSLKIDQS